MMDKQRIAKHFDHLAPERTCWFQRNRIYSLQILEVCRPFLNPDSHVLELGCSTGDLLNLMTPALGVGVDISARSIEIAAQHYPQFRWLCADVESLPKTAPLDEPFDVIVMSDLVGYLYDLQNTLEDIRRLCHSSTRIIISHWNWLWSPALRVAEMLRLKAPDLEVRHNWISPTSLGTFLDLADFEIVQVQSGLLFPYELPVLSPVLNSLSHAPLLDHVTLLRTVVARCRKVRREQQHTSVTVVIPSRNEVGNIEAVVRRLPQMGTHTELLFIDGNSTDGTVEKIHEQISTYTDLDIRFMPQNPLSSPDSDTPPNLMLKLGKGDAIRKAFDCASGEILMILDSDLSVPPEELPRFYDALVYGKGRFANGTRMIYPQQQQSMPFANKLGNVFFSLAFSWLLDQRISDTLCGTKALYRQDYRRIAAQRSYFGNFDPFGDFDLLFGAARLGLPLVEVPVHYGARTYGDSKVRVLKHGTLLLRMSWMAFTRFKLQPLIRGFWKKA